MKKVAELSTSAGHLSPSPPSPPTRLPREEPSNMLLGEEPLDHFLAYWDEG